MEAVQGFIQLKVQRIILGCHLLVTQINTKRVDPLQWDSAVTIIHSVHNRD